MEADDLVIKSNNLEDLESSADSCSLKMNVGKVKTLDSLIGDQKPTTNAEWPCGLSWEEVGANSILCLGSKLWLRKKENIFRCRKRKGEGHNLNSTRVYIEEDTFEAVSTFQAVSLPWWCFVALVMWLENRVAVWTQLTHALLQHRTVLDNHYQLLPIVEFRWKIGLLSSDPASERSYCMVAKLGQH